MFRDRSDAGRQLGQRLLRHREADPLVLAIPRGGVVVGYEVAHLLGAVLDVIVVRKLGAPYNPEFGIGAIGPGGVQVLDNESIAYLRISNAQLDRVIEREQAEMERREKLFRGNRPPLDVCNRVVIVVDDGLATGVSALAAIRSIRMNQPQQLILAVPVAAQQTVDEVRNAVDELVYLELPRGFEAVGCWYEEFEQVSDEQVAALLEQFRSEDASGNTTL